MSSNPGREGGLSFFVEGKLDLKRCLVGKEIRSFRDGLEVTIGR